MRQPANLVPVVGLAAAPDARGIGAVTTLLGTVMRGLDGQISGVRGNLDGDPTRSFNGPVPRAPSVARAQAAVVVKASSIPKPTPTVNNTLTESTALDPYRALLLNHPQG